mmetsp:Transcript_49325/g.107412  ORF Transcript_49325/g.107412 Transcript_49325/m.107412 type:complete len:214 (+) Transcript_49325:509-1150(+)
MEARNTVLSFREEPSMSVLLARLVLSAAWPIGATHGQKSDLHCQEFEQSGQQCTMAACESLLHHFLLKDPYHPQRHSRRLHHDVVPAMTRCAQRVYLLLLRVCKSKLGASPTFEAPNSQPVCLLATSAMHLKGPPGLQSIPRREPSISSHAVGTDRSPLLQASPSHWSPPSPGLSVAGSQTSLDAVHHPHPETTPAPFHPVASSADHNCGWST